MTLLHLWELVSGFDSRNILDVYARCSSRERLRQPPEGRALTGIEVWSEVVILM